MSLYLNDLNHRQWLETVPTNLRQFVPAAIKAWEDQSDSYNKWTDLGWDERNMLVKQQSEKTD